MHSNAIQDYFLLKLAFVISALLYLVKDITVRCIENRDALSRLFCTLQSFNNDICISKYNIVHIINTNLTYYFHKTTDTILF